MYYTHQSKHNCVDGTFVKIHVFVARSPQSNNYNRKFWTVSKHKSSYRDTHSKSGNIPFTNACCYVHNNNYSLRKRHRDCPTSSVRDVQAAQHETEKESFLVQQRSGGT